MSDIWLMYHFLLSKTLLRQRSERTKAHFLKVIHLYKKHVKIKITQLQKNNQNKSLSATLRFAATLRATLAPNVPQRG